MHNIAQPCQYSWFTLHFFFHPRSTASLRFTRFALCHCSIAKQQSLSFQSHAFWVKTVQCALVPEAEILANVKVPWLILAVQICTVFFFTWPKVLDMQIRSWESIQMAKVLSWLLAQAVLGKVPRTRRFKFFSCLLDILQWIMVSFCFFHDYFPLQYEAQIYSLSSNHAY